MRVRWPALFRSIGFTGDEGATAYLGALHIHPSWTIQNQHSIKFEMANGHRHISKQRVSDG